MPKNIKLAYPKRGMSAFTLLEMLLVLWMTSFLIGLPLFLEKRQASRLEEQYFVHRWLELIHAAQVQAITESMGMNVVYRQDPDRFLLETTAGTRVKQLRIPRTVRFRPPVADIAFIPESGHIRKIVRLELELYENKRKLVLQFQIGSGRYRLESAPKGNLTN